MGRQPALVKENRWIYESDIWLIAADKQENISLQILWVVPALQFLCPGERFLKTNDARQFESRYYW